MLSKSEDTELGNNQDCKLDWGYLRGFTLNSDNMSFLYFLLLNPPKVFFFPATKYVIFFPIPINSPIPQIPIGCPTTQFNSGTIYLDSASDFTNLSFSCTGLPHFQMPATYGEPRLPTFLSG